MKKKHPLFKGLHTFILLWSTQAFSGLGSAMTSYALILWSYQQSGSALTTALLSVCSYAPYVIFSIFAGALSDRWNKKRTMLFCDSMAALTTVGVFILLVSGHLNIWHLYAVNALNGLMNTVQQPASDVAVSLLTPKEQYQKAGGMRAFSNSLITIFSPIAATIFFPSSGSRQFLPSIFSRLLQHLLRWLYLSRFLTQGKRRKTNILLCFQPAGKDLVI